jgi:hypothetical protein
MIGMKRKISIGFILSWLIVWSSANLAFSENQTDLQVQPQSQPPQNPYYYPYPYPPQPEPNTETESIEESTRKVGIQFGLAPSIMADFQWNHFYAFASANFIFPIIGAGLKELESDIGLRSILGTSYGFSFGGGISYPISSETRWQFGLLAVSTISSFYDSHRAFGLGLVLTMHLTLPSGFTLGFKAPVIGFAVGHEIDYDGEKGIETISGVSVLSTFYLSTAMSVPYVHIGWRF